jgi:hypothetical protein
MAKMFSCIEKHCENISMNLRQGTEAINQRDGLDDAQQYHHIMNEYNLLIPLMAI